MNRALLARFTHPVWWEDVFPGALFGMPRLTPKALAALNALVFGHPAF